MEVLLTALGGETARRRGHRPAGPRRCTAGFALVEDGGTAIVEVAAASGLTLVAPRRARRVGRVQRRHRRADRRGRRRGRAGGARRPRAAARPPTAARARSRRSTTRGGPARRARSSCCATSARRSSGPPSGSPRRRAPTRRPCKRLRDRLDAPGATLPQRPARRPADRRRRRPGRRAVGRVRRARWSRARRSSSTRSGFDARHARRPRGRRRRGPARRRRRCDGKVAGEIATRARQAGVPCHAIVGANALDRFGARILDLQTIHEAGTPRELELAGDGARRRTC